MNNFSSSAFLKYSLSLFWFFEISFSNLVFLFFKVFSSFYSFKMDASNYPTAIFFKFMLYFSVLMFISFNFNSLWCPSIFVFLGSILFYALLNRSWTVLNWLTFRWSCCTFASTANPCFWRIKLVFSFDSLFIFSLAFSMIASSSFPSWVNFYIAVLIIPRTSFEYIIIV